MKKIIFNIYIWLIAFPVLLVVTIITALLTIILAPLLPNHKLTYVPTRFWSKIVCAMSFVRVKTNGFDHLEQEKSYIFIANHQSIFDVFVIYGWLPFIFKWIMKSDLKRIPLIGKACDSAGHIFIERANPIAAKQSLQIAAEKLKNGNSVVVFPEGTRTRTGKMNSFKRGAFNLASELELPIVPITLSGSYERLKTNSLSITPGTITMTVHQPISFDKFSQENRKQGMQEAWNIINSAL